MQHEETETPKARDLSGITGIVMIEDHGADDGRTHWVVSLDGPNPPADMAIECASRRDAVMLTTLLSVLPSSGMEEAIRVMRRVAGCPVCPAPAPEPASVEARTP